SWQARGPASTNDATRAMPIEGRYWALTAETAKHAGVSANSAPSASSIRTLEPLEPVLFLRQLVVDDPHIRLQRLAAGLRLDALHVALEGRRRRGGILLHHLLDRLVRLDTFADALRQVLEEVAVQLQIVPGHDLPVAGDDGVDIADTGDALGECLAELHA